MKKFSNMMKYYIINDQTLLLRKESMKKTKINTLNKDQ